MNKKRRSPIYFILMLIILIACTKQVGLVTEVEFDLSENYTSEGYVNEPLATTLTVVPEELIEGYIYDYRYTVLSGEGHFEDANGEEVPQGERRPFDPLSKSLNYIGSTVGAHTVRVQATDTYGFTEELELTYILSEVPVTWTATISDSELLVGYQTTVTVTLGNEGTGNATYERNYSISTGSGALTQSDGTGVGLDGYEGITPGTYQYGFVPDALGAVTLTFDLRDSNGQELTASVNLEVVEELSSGENDIIAFTLPEQNGTSLIDDQAHTVSVTVPMGTTLTTAPTVLTVSEGATVTPDMATQQDFTVPVIYTVTAENEEVQEWTVTVIEEATSTDPEITLIGGDITLTVGDTYVEEGATAMDVEDLDISGDIIIDASAVDTNTAGSYQVTYNVTDSDGNAATEVIRTVTVNAVANEPPTATDFSVSVLSNSTDNSIDVYDHIADAENDPLTITIADGSPANGTASITGTVISYTPNNGYTGNDVITYLVDDGNNPAVSATITVMVNAVVNEAPTANNFTVMVEGNSTNNSINVASEISDPENDPLTVSIQTGSPANGTATISGTVISYTPNNGFTGNDVITYLVDDGNNPVVSATITVTVNAVLNNAPNAIDDEFSWTVNGSLNGNVLEDNGNGADSDLDGDTLVVSQVNGSETLVSQTVSGNNGGQLYVLPNGNLEFLPTLGEFDYLDEGETTETAVTYQISDGNGGFDTATVTITIIGISPANQAPTAIVSSSQRTGTSQYIIDFIGNGSTDPDDDILTYSWDFGDGNISNASNPSHTYSSAGIYNVSLVVSDGALTDTYTFSANPRDFVIFDNGSAVNNTGGSNSDSITGQLTITGIPRTFTLTARLITGLGATAYATFYVDSDDYTASTNTAGVNGTDTTVFYSSGTYTYSLDISISGSISAVVAANVNAN
ncbi:DUF5011 domain-containing protein [Maribacter luteus]|uniref:Tandem-95 repeat protein n=1 Tax=Maribacter luteus TaxID=2594478 RepID=A0A6I2MQM5_9FLAO|nr:DUF5011 domain-containing protein [Maribacter luteus]MRX65948.1 tandem-95 repeat protein [Maribacter luteus]